MRLQALASIQTGVAREDRADRLFPGRCNLGRGGPHRMVSRNVILWGVDMQADFMLPGGKLYVPGAEKLLPNVKRLTDAARRGHVFYVSHGCYHRPDDPEFATFPPHCVKGTPGSEYIEHATTSKLARVPNDPAAKLPENLFDHQQIL